MVAAAQLFGRLRQDYYYPAMQLDASNNLLTVFSGQQPVVVGGDEGRGPGLPGMNLR